MGAVSGLIGTAGGFGGSGVSAPELAHISNPVTSAQLKDQYGNAVTGLQQQQDFLKAIQAQNGLQNQSNVYNQLQGVANGTGPNPALAQLQQATGTNVANQAALMAGQRGAGQNAGLIARQAAQQGANIQQQAAGQAATMQAQQSLNALNQMGNLATNQAGQEANATNAYSNSAQGEQGQLLNGYGNYNNAMVGSQTGVNAANAGIIAQSAKSQTGIFGGIGAGMAMAQGGMVPEYADGGNIQVLPSNAPATAAPGPQSSFGKFVNDVSSGLMTSQTPEQNKDPNAQLGQAIGKGIKAGYNYLTKPGVTQGQGLQTDPLGVGSLDKTAIAPSAAGEDALGVGSLSGADAATSATAGADALGSAEMAADLGAAAEGGADLASLAGLLAKGGKVQKYEEGGSIVSDIMKLIPIAAAALAHGGPVKAMVSPGEQYLDPEDVKRVAKDGKNPLAVGERIPGKPKVKGNSYSNDVVPKTLQEGGIVIPNSVMQSKNPAKEASKFVAAVLAKKGHKLPKKST